MPRDRRITAWATEADFIFLEEVAKELEEAKSELIIQLIRNYLLLLKEVIKDSKNNR